MQMICSFMFRLTSRTIHSITFIEWRHVSRTSISEWQAIINDNKTEVITLTAPNVEMNMPFDVIHIGDYIIPPVKCVRDLGVVFDHHMTMHENITKTCASCYFHLRNISSIRDSLTDEATIQLVHAFASSRIDYCNSLLYEIPEYAIKRLQRVQNLAAHVVTRSSKYSSITPMLKKLHWLPVKYCIIFKVVLPTFKALHGMAPNYLKTLLQSYMPSRSLISETGNLLIMPKARCTLGCHTFAYRCGSQVVERTTCEH